MIPVHPTIIELLTAAAQVEGSIPIGGRMHRAVLAWKDAGCPMPGPPRRTWRTVIMHGRLQWHRDDGIAVVMTDRGHHWTEPGHESRPYPTAQAAMDAADLARP